jgi:lipoprotein-anchoring transpeptidase ErfK/SrfK
VALLAIAGLPFGALAWAAKDGENRVPEGVLVGGVDVSGMDRSEAVHRLSQQIGVPAGRPLKVTVDGETYRLGGRRAGVRLDIREAVDRAIARGRRGSFLARGWREISGKKLTGSEPITISVDRGAIGRFVDKIAADVLVPAQDSTVSIAVDSVSVVEGHEGQQLADPAGLKARIADEFKRLNSERRLTASTEVVEPAGTTALDENSTIVTVSKAETLVRVFVGGEIVTSYNVAVGSDEYPTPLGTFSVQSMQVDPPWNVPNSSWAGDLAGKTIPGGDPANPLVARWIGFNGSVGFHGTASAGSLGSAASHGCIRMAPPDVIDLFTRVNTGTPVLVA